MLNINLDENKAICHVKPTSALQQDDFLKLSNTIDNYVNQHGPLKGFIIEAESFPGWENMDAFKAHMKFVKNHLAKFKKVALVTNSPLAFLGEKVVGLFVTPKIKHFPYDQIALAEQWING